MNNISKFTIFTLLLLSMTTMMSNVAIVTTLPHLKDYFVDEKNIEFLSRMMITFPSLAIALLSPFLGHVVFRFGKRNSAVVALALFGLTGSAGLYLDSIELLLFSRFCFGISVAVLMIVTTSLVGDYFQGESRHKFMGIQSAFVAIGGVVFVLGGGILSDINWRYAFGIYAIGLVLIPFALLFIKEIPKNPHAKLDDELGSSLLGIYFLAFLLMTVFYILPTQIPFLIINHFGASSTITGGIISLAFVFNAVGAISFSKLKGRYSFATIYVLGMAILGVGFICIGLVDNVNLFFITSPIMGFGGGILMTNVTAWMLSKAHESKRVKSSGYFTSALFLGQFASPIVFHPVVSYFGVGNFFEVVGGFLICMVFLIFLREKTKKIN